MREKKTRRSKEKTGGGAKRAKTVVDFWVGLDWIGFGSTHHPTPPGAPALLPSHVDDDGPAAGGAQVRRHPEGVRQDGGGVLPLRDTLHTLPEGDLPARQEEEGGESKIAT